MDHHRIGTIRMRIVLFYCRTHGAQTLKLARKNKSYYLGSRGDICFGFGALQSAHCFVKAVRTCRKHALRGFSSHYLSLMRQNCCAPEDEGFPSETRQTSEVVVSVLLRASLTQYRAERPVPRAEQISPRLPKTARFNVTNLTLSISDYSSCGSGNKDGS